jgi:hypothetical protein
MNGISKLLAAVPKPATAVGSSVVIVAVVNILLGLLNGWHWWAAQSTTFQTSVQTVLDVLFGYLAAWVSVVRSKGQSQNIELTSSPLPTLQRGPEIPVPETPSPPVKI